MCGYANNNSFLSVVTHTDPYKCMAAARMYLKEFLDVLTLLYISSVQHLHKQGEGGGE
jgi:hypothetical protein